MIYFFKKLLISPEFLFISLFFYLDMELRYSKNIHVFVIENTWPVMSGSFCTFALFFWKSTFFDMDRTNSIKNFPKKKDIYVTNTVSAIYFISFFSSLLIGVLIKEEFISSVNFIIFGLGGIILLLLTMGINVIVLNVLLRDYSPDSIG